MQAQWKMRNSCVNSPRPAGTTAAFLVLRDCAASMALARNGQTTETTNASFFSTRPKSAQAVTHESQPTEPDERAVRNGHAAAFLPGLPILNPILGSRCVGPFETFPLCGRSTDRGRIASDDRLTDSGRGSNRGVFKNMRLWAAIGCCFGVLLLLCYWSQGYFLIGSFAGWNRYEILDPRPAAGDGKSGGLTLGILGVGGKMPFKGVRLCSASRSGS
jgi:hypothetical protein